MMETKRFVLNPVVVDAIELEDDCTVLTWKGHENAKKGDFLINEDHIQHESRTGRVIEREIRGGRVVEERIIVNTLIPRDQFLREYRPFGNFAEADEFFLATGKRLHDAIEPPALADISEEQPPVELDPAKTDSSQSPESGPLTSQEEQGNEQQHSDIENNAGVSAGPSVGEQHPETVSVPGEQHGS